MQKLAGWILRMTGWTITHDMPQGIPRAVIIMAPHTSGWDFVWGRLGFASKGIKANIVIKKEFFFFPLGLLLKYLGAIPIDRGLSTGTIKKITSMINRSDEFFLLITPEGTRKLVKRWKKGFYFIAQQADVPIILGFLDYKNKTGGLGKVIYPSGNYEKDMEEIEAFYKTKQAKYPEHFNLSPQNLDSLPEG